MPTTVVVTNAGRELENRRLKGESVAEATYIGWGTGGGTASETATALATEAPESRVQGTSSLVTENVANDTYRVTGTMTATANRAITEVGTFNAASSGTLHIYATFDVINLDANNSIEFTIERTLDQAA